MRLSTTSGGGTVARTDLPGDLAARQSGADSTNIAQLEGRHRGGTGNALRAAVLGVNDGLLSTVSLVMGVAGADPGRVWCS